MKTIKDKKGRVFNCSEYPYCVAMTDNLLSRLKGNNIICVRLVLCKSKKEAIVIKQISKI